MTPAHVVSRLALILILVSVNAAPAHAQTSPDYAGASVSQYIPFANTQEQPFTHAPELLFSLEGSQEIHKVQMDTGSVGIAMSAHLVPDYARLKTNPRASAGTQFLSSSKVLWVGTWVPVTVTLYGKGKTALMTSSVLVLGVEQSGTCPSYQQDRKICPDLPSTEGKRISYMGVGFGQEADFQPQGTPDKNVLLNVVRINGQPVAQGKLNKGYIIGLQGIEVGLTTKNTRGFRFARLQPYKEYPGDWMPPTACITVNPAINTTAAGPICTPATVLVDTGIPQSYMTVPKAIQFETAQQEDASVPGKMVSVLARDTVVQVNIPGLPAIASDSFTVGQGSLVEPTQVIPWHTDTRNPFINTGRHFLRSFQFLYDARQGFIGLKEQPKKTGG